MHLEQLPKKMADFLWKTRGGLFFLQKTALRTSHTKLLHFQQHTPIPVASFLPPQKSVVLARRLSIGQNYRQPLYALVGDLRPDNQWATGPTLLSDRCSVICPSRSCHVRHRLSESYWRSPVVYQRPPNHWVLKKLTLDSSMTAGIRYNVPRFPDFRSIFAEPAPIVSLFSL